MEVTLASLAGGTRFKCFSPSVQSLWRFNIGGASWLVRVIHDISSEVVRWFPGMVSTLPPEGSLVGGSDNTM